MKALAVDIHIFSQTTCIGNHEIVISGKYMIQKEILWFTGDSMTGYPCQLSSFAHSSGRPFFMFMMFAWNVLCFAVSTRFCGFFKNLFLCEFVGVFFYYFLGFYLQHLQQFSLGTLLLPELPTLCAASSLRNDNVYPSVLHVPLIPMCVLLQGTLQEMYHHRVWRLWWRRRRSGRLRRHMQGAALRLSEELRHH